MKLCTKCKVLKEVDAFAKDGSRNDGLNNKCRECRKLYKTLPRTTFVETESQICTKCTIKKDLLEFPRDSRRKTGYGPTCKKCSYQTQKTWRYTSAGKHKRSIDKQNRILINQEYIIDYLRTHPCIDCGNADILVLDFDHIDPTTKRESVHDMIRKRRLNILRIEITKCDVRCANCHRRRTADQFGSWKLAYLEQQQCG